MPVKSHLQDLGRIHRSAAAAAAVIVAAVVGFVAAAATVAFVVAAAVVESDKGIAGKVATPRQGSSPHKHKHTH